MSSWCPPRGRNGSARSKRCAAEYGFPRLRGRPLRHTPVIRYVQWSKWIVRRPPVVPRRIHVCRRTPAILLRLRAAPVLAQRLAYRWRRSRRIGMHRLPRCPVMSPRRHLASRHPRPLPPMPPDLDIIIFVHQASPVSLSAQDCRIRRMIADDAASCRCRASSATSGSCPDADCAPLSPRQTLISPGVNGRPSPAADDGRTGLRLPMSVRGTIGRVSSGRRARRGRRRAIATTDCCRRPASAIAREFYSQPGCDAVRATRG